MTSTLIAIKRFRGSDLQAFHLKDAHRLGRSGFQVWGRMGGCGRDRGPGTRYPEGLKCLRVSAEVGARPAPTSRTVPSCVALLSQHEKAGVGVVTVVPRSPWPGRLSTGSRCIRSADQQASAGKDLCFALGTMPARGDLGKRQTSPLPELEMGFLGNPASHINMRKWAWPQR